MEKRILVIDDDAAVRKAFMMALEDTGHVVRTAASGDEALKEVTANHYDLFFLDLKMPGMNGVETLRELRRMGITSPVYIVTGFHREFTDQLKEAEREGADFELFQKPISEEQILMVVRSSL